MVMVYSRIDKTASAALKISSYHRLSPYQIVHISSIDVDTLYSNRDAKGPDPQLQSTLPSPNAETRSNDRTEIRTTPPLLQYSYPF